MLDSSLRMVWLTAGWVRCSFCAAREKLRLSATARKVSSWNSSIRAPRLEIRKLRITGAYYTKEFIKYTYSRARGIAFHHAKSLVRGLALLSPKPAAGNL